MLRNINFTKMYFKRIGLMTIAAGLAITSFNACSQDEDLEGYVLNEGNGVSTLAKRSMGRGGESTGPVAPSREYDEREVTFEYVEGSIADDAHVYYDGLTVKVRYSFIWENHKPSEVQLEYYYEKEDHFSIEDVSLTESYAPGHYNLICEGTDDLWGAKYIGIGEAFLSE